MAKRLPLEEYVNLKDAAEEAGCARQWIAQLIDAGKLPSVSIGGRRFVKRSDAKAITVRAKRETADVA